MQHYKLCLIVGFNYHVATPTTSLGVVTLVMFHIAQVIVIPRYEYDIVVITRVRGEAEYEC